MAIRLTVKVKIAVVLAASAFGTLCAIGGLTYLLRSSRASHARFTEQTRAQSEFSFRTLELAAKMQNLTLMLVRERDLDVIESLMRQSKAASKEIKELLDKGEEAGEELKAAVDALVKADGLVTEARMIGEGARATQIFIDQSSSAFQALLQAVRKREKELQVSHDQEAKAAQARELFSQRAVILGVILLVALASVLGVLMMRNVSRALGNLVNKVSLVAGGDLRVVLSETGGGAGSRAGPDDKAGYRDEIHDIYGAFSDMLVSLRELQGRVAAAFGELEQAVERVTVFAGDLQMGADEQSRAVEGIAAFVTRMNDQASGVAQSMGELAGVSESTSSSILEMIASIEQVAQNTNSLSGSVDQTSSSIEEVVVSNKGVAKNIDSLKFMIAKVSSAVMQIDASVKEVQRLAKESELLTVGVRESAQTEGSTAVKEVISEMDRLRTSIQSLAETFDKLSRSIGSIGDILTIIEDVAARTNLLALNAAILAAQAGENGRGFAVVAEEIRELAERTTASTKEISHVIGGIQAETKSVTSLMGEGVERANLGVQAVNRTEKALRNIIASSEKALVMSSRIVSATDEQGVGSRDAARSIQEVLDQASEIARATEEQALGSENIMRAVVDMRDLAEQVRAATKEQTSGARLISKASSESAGLAQRVTKASQESKLFSGSAVSEVSRIRSSGQKTLEIVTQMKQIVESFNALAGHLKNTLSQFRT